jgi:hypothetical protein
MTGFKLSDNSPFTAQVTVDVTPQEADHFEPFFGPVTPQ